MKVVDSRKKRKLIPETTKEIIAAAIKAGKNAYEIASLVKLTDEDVRYAAKALGLTRELNANEGCMMRKATPEELELGDLKAKPEIAPDDDVEFMPAPEVEREAPEPEPEVLLSLEPEKPRRQRKKPGPKPGTKKAAQAPQMTSGAALLGTIRILEDISQDMIDAGAQTDPSSTGWLGYSYEQICEALKLLRMLDRICQRLSH